MKRHVLTVLVFTAVFAAGWVVSGCKTSARSTATVSLLTGTQERPSIWDNVQTPNSYVNPVVYSFDGREYRLEAELFTGAFFKNAERPDWLAMKYLQEINGRYQIKLTNDMKQTQYLDELQLLVVDHPKGRQVYPSYKGQLYTLCQLRSPRSAVDKAGTDVREFVEKSDGDFWLSNPMNRNPRDKSQLRDALVLEYDRPEGAMSAVLLLQVQNTFWSADMLNDLLDVPGEDLPLWYDRLNQSPEARNALVRALIRENMLRIHVWDGQQWRPAGYVWQVGNAAAKNVVEEIDLFDIPGNRVKIKLECPPGMWMVNSAQIDYSYYTIPTMAQQVLPQKAIDQDGQDVLPLLKKADNQYHQLTAAGDEVLVEFPAPAQPAGVERTYILKGVGYFVPGKEAEGFPQLERLDFLLKQPGALNQFALESIQKKVVRYNKIVPILQ